MVVEPPGNGLGAKAAERFGDVEIRTEAPLYTDNQASGVAAPGAMPLIPSQQHVLPLVLDPRIKRMLRLAIASSKAVMLVGSARNRQDHTCR